MPALSSVLTGRNLSIFAYGQSGSGKTHTINGSNTEDPGIISRTIAYLLESRKQKTHLEISYLEIYNEKVRSGTRSFSYRL